MVNISIQLSKEYSEYIDNYTKKHNVSVNETIARAIEELIYYENDVEAAEKAMEDMKKNPKTYTLDEVEKQLGI